MGMDLHYSIALTSSFPRKRETWIFLLLPGLMTGMRRCL